MFEGGLEIGHSYAQQLTAVEKKGTIKYHKPQHLPQIVKQSRSGLSKCGHY
jgi:hypothetical protein